MSGTKNPGSVHEVRAEVQRARAAQEHWRLRPLAARIEALQGAAKEMLRRRGEVIALAQDEMKKVANEALFNEALGPLETVNAWASVVTRATRTRRVRLNPLSFPKKRAQVDLLPRGVIGIIAPWNYPVAGLYRATIPALLTGNGVVVKPSEHTPRTSGWFLDILASHLPDGLVRVVQGDGRAGAMVVDAGIDACVFTGSIAAGREVRLRCAELGIPSSIEMGGKDAAIVLADADLPRTTAAITHWTLSNVGQACGAIEIAYVDRSIADDFVERLRRAWTALEIGDGPDADLGPLANDQQLATVTSQVDDARAKGAQVVCGGATVAGGRYYAPTVLDFCDERMAVVTDETFGPVLAVVRVDGAEDAIRKANASRYGLGVSIWSHDLARAGRLAERLDVGVVTINNHAFSGAIPALPWSGTRATGFGIANGPESLGTFVRPRAMIVDGSSDPEPFFLPYDRSLWELGDILADVQLGRIRRAWRLPLLLRRRVARVKKFFA